MREIISKELLEELLQKKVKSFHVNEPMEEISVLFDDGNDSELNCAVISVYKLITAIKTWAFHKQWGIASGNLFFERDTADVYPRKIFYALALHETDSMNEYGEYENEIKARDYDEWKAVAKVGMEIFIRIHQHPCHTPTDTPSDTPCQGGAK